MSRFPGGLKGKEAQPWFDASFDKPVIVFDHVVEVLDLPQFTGVGKSPLFFQPLEGFWIDCIFIDSDHARRHGVRRGKRFREEAFGRLRITSWTQEELERVSLGICCARFDEVFREDEPDDT